MTELIEKDDVLRFFYDLLDPISIPIYILRKPARLFDDEFVIINTLPLGVSYTDCDLIMHGFVRKNNRYKKVNPSLITHPRPGSTGSTWNYDPRYAVPIHDDVVIQYCRVNINYYVKKNQLDFSDNKMIKNRSELIKKTIERFSSSICFIFFQWEEPFSQGNYSALNHAYQFNLIHYK